MSDTDRRDEVELSDSLGMIVEVVDTARPEIDESEARRIIEAVLYAAGHPVTYAKLAEVLGTTEARARGIVCDYADVYNSSGDIERGVIMLCYDDCCQLSTKEAYGEYIRAALGIRRGGNLSPSSLEVLAIIAYNEPVTRAYVDLVRGVDSSYAVGSLADKHMIEVCGRLDVPGRPLLYRTTPDFLRVFGLNSLADLPKVATEAPMQEGDVLPIEDMEASLPNDAIGAAEDAFVPATEGTAEFIPEEDALSDDDGAEEVFVPEEDDASDEAVGDER